MARAKSIAEIVLAMKDKPNKRFGTVEILQIISDDVCLRSVQRYLEELLEEGVLTSDGSNPKGYRLAVLNE